MIANSDAFSFEIRTPLKNGDDLRCPGSPSKIVH
jgi:hypothetical protein